jgi:hypothetical protein
VLIPPKLVQLLTAMCALGMESVSFTTKPPHIVWSRPLESTPLASPMTRPALHVASVKVALEKRAV